MSGCDLSWHPLSSGSFKTREVFSSEYGVLKRQEVDEKRKWVKNYHSL